MAQFHAKFTEKIQRTAGTVSFRFQAEGKPSFVPGQFVCVMFDRQNKLNRKLNKYLSFSGAPAKPYIEVTKRLSESEFSRRLLELRPGDTVLFDGPLGNCVLREEYKKIGFLIGGIGITPVISMVEHAAENNLPADMVLFYSNRTEAEIAFKAELDEWQKKMPSFRIIYALTDCEPVDPRCVRGRIDKEIIAAHAPDFKERLFFIFGPPKMVEAMKTLCVESGCAKELVKTESFTGY